MVTKVDPVEARSDERHRRVAALIRRDPAVIDTARGTLDRWLQRDPHPALLEWKAAFTMLDANEMAAFLESTTPKARRMRISSPFVGLAA